MGSVWNRGKPRAHGDGARAPCRTRGGGGRLANEGRRDERGRSRRRATRCDTCLYGGGEPPAKGAERPSHGGDRTGSCRLHPQAQRAASDSERRRQGSSPEGRRPRQRASWSRAGRSRARRNRARRPVPWTGRSPLSSGFNKAISDRNRPGLRQGAHRDTGAIGCVSGGAAFGPRENGSASDR